MKGIVATSGITQEIAEQVAQLSPELQQRVLDFARALAAHPLKGVSGEKLFRLVGTMDRDDIRAIERVTEAECEKEEARVIVVFLEPSDSGVIDLRSRGIDETLAQRLRARLETFAEEWDSPEMDIYDHYDEARASL